MSKLAGYFDEKLIVPRDFAASKAQSIRDLGSGSDDLGQAVVSASTEVLRTSYRVDYSSYDNFVFFNSALNYFNITGEKIINDYPTTGSFLEVLNFSSGCDDYQKWLFENSWLAVQGDNGGHWGYVKDPNQLMNPVADSFTIELLGYIDNTISGTLVEKKGPSNAAYSIWGAPVGSTSTLYFQVSGTSGSVTVSMSLGASEALAGTDVKRYMAFVCDQSNDTISIIHAPDVVAVNENRHLSGFILTYFTSTVVVSSASISTIGLVTANSGTGSVFLVGSGTHGLCNSALTNVSFWSKARSLDEINESYGAGVRAQADLVALYRFNQIVPESGGTYLIEDAAGNSLDLHLSAQPSVTIFSGTAGAVDLVVSQSRLSMSSYTPEPVTIFGQIGALSNSLENYVGSTQLTASAYDKGNTNLITNFVPAAYLDLEEQVGTEVLRRFLYIIARQFDQIKVGVDQFIHWNKTNYIGFDETPDALLQEAAKFYGWDFVGNFLNHDAIKYFFGKGVIPGADLERKLYQIKNEFWRRSLNELMHIYKTKGTRESVEALMRVYGVDQKLIKLKEYGSRKVSGIKTNRINSHRTVPAFVFPSGTTDSVSSLAMTGLDGFTVSLHGKFLPIAAGGDLTGTIFAIGDHELRYYSNVGNVTGTVALFNVKSGVTNVSGAIPLMDGRWWNLFACIPGSGTSGTDWIPRVAAQYLDEDTIAGQYDYTGPWISSSLPGVPKALYIGHGGGQHGGTYYLNEVKFYHNYCLSGSEQDAQTYDFQSYGTMDIDDLTGSLRLHWRLDDDFTIPDNVNASLPEFNIFDFSSYGTSGTINMPVRNVPYSPFQKFVTDYNFIAPMEFGWTDEKIRVFEGSEIEPGDQLSEVNAVALEFNLVDALNEDISKILATMENWNNVIGSPVNHYREDYPDLQKYRTYYFKKLNGRINFRKFADILEFFDRTFVKMIERLLPARAVFYGEEFVVESHMLERPKVQWAYRRYNPELVPEGILTMIDHSGSDTSAVSTTLIYR